MVISGSLKIFAIEWTKTSSDWTISIILSVVVVVVVVVVDVVVEETEATEADSSVTTKERNYHTSF